MWTIVRCCGLAAVWWAASSAVGADAGVERAWRELFAQTAPASAARQIDAVLAACGNDAAAIKALIASDTAYPPAKPGWLRRTIKVSDGKKECDAEFFVRIPPGYTPAKSYPLLMAAHGTDGDGKTFAARVADLLGTEADKYVIIGPTLPMPGPKRFDAKPYQEQAYLKSISWAGRNLNIDDDRIYITGYSQGGHVAWHMATMYPRLFASAVPMAGVPWFEGGLCINNLYLENLANLPVWAIWGEKDYFERRVLPVVDICRAAGRKLTQIGCTNYIGEEIPGAGHGDCWPKRDRFARYLASHKRRAVPAKFSHFFHLPHHRRGYYVEVIELGLEPIDFDKKKAVKVSVRPGQKLTPQDVVSLRRKYYAKFLFRIWARLDRRDNSLTILAGRVRSVRVYVMEGMFDLSRPVTLRWGARTWRGRVPASARCILTHYAATRDATALIYNEIDFDKSGKAAVRFK